MNGFGDISFFPYEVQAQNVILIFSRLQNIYAQQLLQNKIFDT